MNSARVELVWEYTLEANERFRISAIDRQGPGENKSTRIATRIGEKSAFILASSEFKADYEAKLPATLVLLDVKNNEEYTYTFLLTYNDSARNYNRQFKVSVVVYGKWGNILKILDQSSLFTEWNANPNVAGQVIPTSTDRKMSLTYIVLARWWPFDSKK